MKCNKVKLFPICKRVALSLYFRVGSRVTATFRLKLRKIKKRQILGIEEGNSVIRQAILLEKPIMISRFGTTEGKFLLGFYSGASFHDLRKSASDLWRLSGVYPIDESSLGHFASVYSAGSREIDLLGVRSAPSEFSFWHLEKWLTEKLSRTSILFDIEALLPLTCEIPWTLALESKRVLIIHPFVESMKVQYPKRQSLFGGKPPLPQFEPIWLCAPQTLGFEYKNSTHSSWATHLQELISQIEKLNFDVALIGCGAYGLPIAAKVKTLGKQAIHVGGALQILFGIKGQRWDKELQAIIPPENYREWVWPSQDETPMSARQVEGGAYWSPESIQKS